MKERRIVLYGGSLNPPTHAHVAAVRALVKRFDRVVVIPCGMRPDKRETSRVNAAHRENLVRLAVEDTGAELDLSDLHHEQFLTAFELNLLWERPVGSGWEVWHAVGSDLVVGGSTGRSEIQRCWDRGTWVWNNLRFAVLPREGYPITPNDLPPLAELLPNLGHGESSRNARAAFARGEPGLAGVPRAVREYVCLHSLYG